ncbi:MAG: GntR family transcriptional regulator [Acidimicrobiia bacterium]
MTVMATHDSTAADRVATHLREMIGSGELNPGDPIVIETTAARLGVSAQPVREALKTLESEGRVIHEAHRGTRVTKLNSDDLAELAHLRSILEVAELRESVARLDAERLDQLDQIAAAFDRADGTEMLRLTRTFSEVLRSGATNPRLHAHVESLRAATDPYRYRYFSNDVDQTWVRSIHHAIAEAARRRDIETVLELVNQQRQVAFDVLHELGVIEPGPLGLADRLSSDSSDR